jgi:hypothetical protein
MNLTSLRLVPVMLLTTLSAACGGDSNSGSGNTNPVSLATVTQQTAQQSAECRQIQPFYFEIGDAAGALVSGSVGDNTYTATTPMNIASGTKWLFGAYVAQVRNGVLSAADLRATRMRSGYVSMGSACGPGATVQSCFNAGSNDTFTATSVGRFHYDSGHFQKWGVDNGLASMDAAQLAADFRAVLGNDVPVSFSGPLLAGGAVMSAQGYAAFLRKLLNNQLHMAGLLDAGKICTRPGVCATADFSPVPLAWSYGIGHWIEDDPAGDGSFSSPGALGFYPWIDSTRTYYGIVARVDTGAGTALDSIECGQHIRKAFLTATVQ